MRGRWWLAAPVLLCAARAVAADADPDGPSVCAPPCADGETCVGNACLAHGVRRPARPAAATRAPPEPEPAPAPTTAPQAVPAPLPSPPIAPRSPPPTSEPPA